MNESGAVSGQNPRETQMRPAAAAPDSGQPGAESGQVSCDTRDAPAAPAPWLAPRWADMTWRMRARTVIRRVTAQAREDGLTDEKEIIKRIDAAYPFGEREYYPYKMWLMERRIAKSLLRGGLPELAIYKPVPELEAWLRARGGSAG